jgi:hypothetical protein
VSFSSSFFLDFFWSFGLLAGDINWRIILMGSGCCRSKWGVGGV